MNSIFKINIFILVLLVIAAPSTHAQAFGKDNGTDINGVFIFPKELALHCGISSKDIVEEKVMGKCLNKVLGYGRGSLANKPEIKKVYEKAYHQMNAAYISLALNKKGVASDYEAETDKILGEEMLSAPGLSSDEESNLKKQQEKIAKLGYMSSKNVVDIIDVYSSKIALESMRYYGLYEIPVSGSAPVDE